MRWNNVRTTEAHACADCGDPIERGEAAIAVYNDAARDDSRFPPIPTDYYHDHCIRCDKCRRVVQPPLYEHRVLCDGR